MIDLTLTTFGSLASKMDIPARGSYDMECEDLEEHITCDPHDDDSSLGRETTQSASNV